MDEIEDIEIAFGLYIMIEIARIHPWAVARLAPCDFMFSGPNFTEPSLSNDSRLASGDMVLHRQAVERLLNDLAVSGALQKWWREIAEDEDDDDSG